MQVSKRSDICVGYLNLRDWQSNDDLIENWDPASGQILRVLVGMQRPPHEEIRELYRAAGDGGSIDNAAVVASTILNSSLLYAWFVTFGDCFRVADTLVSAFPVPDAAWADRELVALNGRLMKQLKQGAVRKVIASR